MQCFKAELHEKSGWDEDQMKVLECGIRWAVEARRRGRDEQQEQRRHDTSKNNGGGESKGRTQDRNKASKESKCVSAKKNSLGETRAESTDEPEVLFRLAEVRTGRGSAGLVRGRDEWRWAEERQREG